MVRSVPIVATPSRATTSSSPDLLSEGVEPQESKQRQASITFSPSQLRWPESLTLDERQSTTLTSLVAAATVVAALDGSVLQHNWTHVEHVAKQLVVVALVAAFLFAGCSSDILPTPLVACRVPNWRSFATAPDSQQLYLWRTLVLCWSRCLHRDVSEHEWWPEPLNRRPTLMVNVAFMLLMGPKIVVCAGREPHPTSPLSCNGLAVLTFTVLTAMLIMSSWAGSRAPSVCSICRDYTKGVSGPTVCITSDKPS